MKLETGCLICRNYINCTCKADLVRFLALSEIGEKVRLQSVLSPISSSSCLSKKVLSAGIDKLDGDLIATLSVDEINQIADKHNLKRKLVQLSDKRFYLKIFFEKASLYFRLNFEKTHITHIVSNPNKFSSFVKYMNSLGIILSGRFYLVSITRLDFNLDFQAPLMEVLTCLDFKKKSNNGTFLSKSGTKTGMQVGAGEETCIVYDKGKKERIKADWTRVELRLTGKKLITRKLTELSARVLEHPCFDNYIGLRLTFTDSNFLSEEQKDKQNHFKNILQHDGYFMARKKFSKNRNFDRDFNDLIKIEKWETQPDQLFNQHIFNFLNQQRNTNEK